MYKGVIRTVLLTGATGYVGGRLLPRLLAAGWRVRCLARRPEVLRARVPVGLEVVRGDVLDPASLAFAMAGVDAAVYLVHSMGDGAGFARTDSRAAHSFGAAARMAGVGRIVYLGALGREDESLSRHLRSRQEVGRILRGSGVPVIELRASIILGAGSLSFELIRSLVERLPVMLLPRWVRTQTQPIWIGDVIEAILWALEREVTHSVVHDIGGPDVVSYRDLMREYARQRGLRRWMIPVPALTPWLSSLWLGLVTPVYALVGRALIDGVRVSTVVRPGARPPGLAVPPVGVSDAIARALREQPSSPADARWSDGTWLAEGRRARGGEREERRLIDRRVASAAASPRALFAAVERIGGSTGWYDWDTLWRVRGWLDLLAGGVGMRRGRRDPERLAPGDVVDCWRVEEIERDHRLLLRAEMRLPGRAWLELVAEPAPDGKGSILTQTATLAASGRLGIAYWYALGPLHRLVFGGMLRGIVRSAERSEASGTAAG